jgi:hypothetical protein
LRRLGQKRLEKARLENYRLEKARKGREAWEGLEKFYISVLNLLRCTGVHVWGRGRDGGGVMHKYT